MVRYDNNAEELMMNNKQKTIDMIQDSGLPPLEGDYSVAERLVLLIHRGVDWDVWGGARRVKYWDALADRVKAATYAGNTLSHWWQYIGLDMPSSPKNAQDRKEAAFLLASENQKNILKILRGHSSTLVLRVRVISEIMREQRNLPVADSDDRNVEEEYTFVDKLEENNE